MREEGLGSIHSYPRSIVGNLWVPVLLVLVFELWQAPSVTPPDFLKKTSPYLFTRPLTVSIFRPLPNAAPPTMEGGGSVEAEAQLYDLARAAGLEISPDMFAVVIDLLRLDVLPQGIIALLRALKDLRLRAPVAVAEVR